MHEDPHTLSRRQLLTTGSAALAGGGVVLAGWRTAAAQQANVPGMDQPRAGSADAEGRPYTDQHWDVPGEPGKDYTPVITPNGWTLPFQVVDGVKVFHMTADEVHGHEFAEGLVADCWGYNGGVHGPTLEAVEGDRVRIYVTNRLRAPTTVHWHGLLLPCGMDGVGGLNQRAIQPGETFHYEFTLRQHGAFQYHSHHDEMTQMAMGMMGMFIIHRRGVPPDQRPDRDYVYMLSEWAITPGTRRPDPNEMTDFNILTLNARAFPGTAPMVARLGQKVRIRIGNLSAMDHHPIHLHGYQFRITETNGGPIDPAGQWPETTVLVPVGTTRTIEFVADEPGDWAMHCHMTHHVMNQMGHDIPNMIGVETDGLDAKVQRLLPAYMTMGQEGMGDMGDMGMAVPHNSIPMVGARGPFDYITMGGMFTILKVRPTISDADLASNTDPGWYDYPAGTVADLAQPARLRSDNIAADGASAPMMPAAVRAASRQAPGQDPHAAHPATAPAAHAHPAEPHPAEQGTEALYVCPMHPQITSATPARCSICGMKLVLKP